MEEKIEELIAQYNNKKEFAYKLYAKAMNNILDGDYINPDSIVYLNEAYEERLQNINEWFFKEVSKLGK